MMPTERRIAAMRLLARIEQGISECDALLSRRRLRPSEQRYVRVQRDFRRKAPKRVEQLIERSGPSGEP